MKEFIILFVSPFLITVVGGVVVIAIEYWVIQPLHASKTPILMQFRERHHSLLSFFDKLADQIKSLPKLSLFVLGVLSGIGLLAIILRTSFTFDTVTTPNDTIANVVNIPTVIPISAKIHQTDCETIPLVFPQNAGDLALFLRVNVNQLVLMTMPCPGKDVVEGAVIFPAPANSEVTIWLSELGSCAEQIKKYDPGEGQALPVPREKATPVSCIATPKFHSMATSKYQITLWRSCPIPPPTNKLCSGWPDSFNLPDTR